MLGMFFKHLDAIRKAGFCSCHPTPDSDLHRRICPLNPAILRSVDAAGVGHQFRQFLGRWSCWSWPPTPPTPATLRWSCWSWPPTPPTPSTLELLESAANSGNSGNSVAGVAGVGHQLRQLQHRWRLRRLVVTLSCYPCTTGSWSSAAWWCNGGAKVVRCRQANVTRLKSTISTFGILVAGLFFPTAGGAWVALPMHHRLLELSGLVVNG